MHIVIYYQLLYNSILQQNSADTSEAAKLKWFAYGLWAVLCWYFRVHLLFHKTISNQQWTQHHHKDQRLRVQGDCGWLYNSQEPNRPTQKEQPLGNWGLNVNI